MIITVQQHLLQQQRNVSEATGRFTWLMHGITLATKMVESKIRSAGLTNILGAYGETNVQGEQQQKLDVYANQALLHCLGLAEGVAALVSEEDESPITVDLNPDNGKYLVVFDPLDGSSNIDVNVNVGTIFSVLRRPENGDANDHDVSKWALQPGYKQVAAGYVLYGPSTILVYTAGNGVFGFTLDPSVGAYVMTNEKMCMPEQGPYYSTNEGNANDWPEVFREYVAQLKAGEVGGQGYGARYIGSLVADFHRTLLKGGVFLYPPTKKQPGGKLRLLYEANPLAFIAEQAGGMAVSGLGPGSGRILEIEPTAIHQRTPLVVGSMVEVKAFTQLLVERGA